MRKLILKPDTIRILLAADLLEVRGGQIRTSQQNACDTGDKTIVRTSRC